MTATIDCDQHLYEPRNLWRDHAEPGARDDALTIEDDERGYAWITWRGQRLGMADVQAPGETEVIGERRRKQQEGAPAPYRYDDVLPDDFWQPAARADAHPGNGLRRRRVLPQLRLALGAARRRRPPLTTHQHGFVEPLVQHRRARR